MGGGGEGVVKKRKLTSANNATIDFKLCLLFAVVLIDLLLSHTVDTVLTLSRSIHGFIANAVVCNCCLSVDGCTVS